MRIESLELIGFKRLSLNNIKYLKITPINIIQLILGTNGSGKSSLLKELSPLPANPTEYHKDGSKIIMIVHNNSRYELKSIFSSTGNKFWFIKDGEEQNPGGTTTVYKELVKKEFNITQDVHDLMTGLTGFHNLSVAERRNWFTKLSDVDYTYAVQYYQRLKEQYRDVTGAIKLNQSRLVQESEKLLKPEEEVQYRKEIEELNKLLSLLLEAKSPIVKTKSDLEKNCLQQESQIETLANQLFKYRRLFLNDEGFQSPQEIDDTIIDVRSQIQVEELRIQELCKNIEQQQITIDTLQKNNIESVTDFDSSVTVISEELDTLYRQLRHDLRFSDANQAYQALLSIYENLVEVAHNLEVNTDKIYSRDNYVASLEQQKHLTQQFTEKNAILDKMILSCKEMEHARDHNQIECPRCKYSWIKGYSLDNYEGLQRAIGIQINDIEKIQIKLNELETHIVKMKEYLEQYRVYINISRSWEILNPLWNYLLNSNILFEDPKRIPSLLEGLKIDLQIWIKIDETNKRLKETSELRELIMKNQETDITHMRDTAEQMNLQLYRLNSSLQVTKTKLSRIQLYKQIVQEVQQCQAQLEAMLNKREDTYKEMIDVSRKETVNDLIQFVQLELNKREQVISKINIQKALVASIEIQIAELAEYVEIYKLAIKELSPAEGLIAKGLTGFINHFVTQMNNFIKKIWLYPLELIPIAPDEEEGLDLDFKFAVRINESHPIPDIKLASSAMKEVIDLAFRIVSMPYLGLETAPLFLDEFSKGLDHAHRESAFYAITSLLTSSNFSQVFMISHYEQSYGSLKNADITVLCPSNVVLPKGLAFNTVTTMH